MTYFEESNVDFTEPIGAQTNTQLVLEPEPHDCGCGRTPKLARCVEWVELHPHPALAVVTESAQTTLSHRAADLAGCLGLSVWRHVLNLPCHSLAPGWRW